MGKSEGWLQAGVAVASVSGGGWIAYWIFSLQPPGVSMWPWPGWGFVGGVLIGACMMAPSLLQSKSEDKPPVQKLRAGNRSRNYQAGGDIRIGATDDDS